MVMLITLIRSLYIVYVYLSQYHSVPYKHEQLCAKNNLNNRIYKKKKEGKKYSS